ncbi:MULTISPECIES: caspase family protein [unclassified Chitinophaga]|uniref:caspase family protein n=1 Tax=unclassified Chitinophaga TaxID=2619133 RepID=UPI0009D62DC3|nr:MULTISPECIES: caspase family protein [unclassified Chitinophaga]OMP81026.1 peptidase C14 [[Flexibacter] sp. ATCC 35208]WPV67763.1 caspase family protein [Chitinophaga sp. LS1]
MRRALVVGINDYPGSARLYGCVNDATSIGEVLSSNEDGAPNFDVMLMTKDHSKAAIKSRLMELFSGDDEIHLFYFSGHGMVNEMGGYIVTPDFQRYDEGISMDDILMMAATSKAMQKVIVLDCCHAGAMGTPVLMGNGMAVLGKGVVILASSRDSEKSKEVGGMGVFTSLLLKALHGGAADIVGDVTAGNIYSYIDRGLGGWQQRPVFKANIARSLNLRKVKPPLDLGDLRLLRSYFPEVAYEMPLDPSYEYTVEGADSEHIRVFKVLRRMQGVGLVEPVDEEYMYWAAMNSGKCRLTPLGMYYWQLVKEGRI